METINPISALSPIFLSSSLHSQFLRWATVGWAFVAHAESPSYKFEFCRGRNSMNRKKCCIHQAEFHQSSTFSSPKWQAGALRHAQHPNQNGKRALYGIHSTRPDLSRLVAPAVRRFSSSLFVQYLPSPPCAFLPGLLHISADNRRLPLENLW